jgi:hypothetical protein
MAGTIISTGGIFACGDVKWSEGSYRWIKRTLPPREPMMSMLPLILTEEIDLSKVEFPETYQYSMVSASLRLIEEFIEPRVRDQPPGRS